MKHDTRYAMTVLVQGKPMRHNRLIQPKGSHALFVDYTPKHPIEAVLSFIAPFLESLRKGMENLLDEVQFVTPYFLGGIEKSAVATEEIATKSLTRLLKTKWLFPFIFSTFWLFN